MRPDRRNTRGQAAVETAITLPTLIFVLLGLLQLTLAHHARIAAEVAAFRAARAGSLFRGDCDEMKRAALLTLVPTMPSPAAPTAAPQTRYVETAREIVYSNLPVTAVGRGAGIPLVLLERRLGNPRDRFDDHLAPGTPPMSLHVKLTYLYEARVPFANWIMSRFWYAGQTGVRWAETNPLMPVGRDAAMPAVSRSAANQVLNLVNAGHAVDYYVLPIVASWSTRMQSDPFPNRGLSEGGCASP